MTHRGLARETHGSDRVEKRHHILTIPVVAPGSYSAWPTLLKITRRRGQFFVVQTATYRLVRRPDCAERPYIVHIAVTPHPTAEWTRQQLPSIAW
jgi:hypothetical protein